MKSFVGTVATILAASLAYSPAAYADAHDIKITKITKTKLDSGTCALDVHFKDKSPKSLDANDFYSLTISRSVEWDGQWFSDHFLVYPCDAFKKGKRYSFVVKEWDDNGKRQKVVAESPAFHWKAE